MENPKELHLYEQLRKDMIGKIAAREWMPGQRIPAEMDLCESYGVSRITVRKAIEDLVGSGHLRRYRGKGTFVRMELIENKLSKFYSFSEALKSKGLKEFAEVLAFETVTVDVFLAEKLRLYVSDRVYKLMRLRSVDEMPYAVETSYIPKAQFPTLTGEFIAENGLYNAMQLLGITPNRATETFHVDSMDGLEARLLQQNSREPVMCIERLTLCDDLMVEYCRSIVRGDFFNYTVELGY